MLVSGGFLAVDARIILRLAHLLEGKPSPADRVRLAMEACYCLSMAMLLLTPTLQPWYALSLALFLPFCAGPAGLVLCWTVFLTYRVQIPFFIQGQWIEDPRVTAAVCLAPAAAYLLSKVIPGLRSVPE